MINLSIKLFGNTIIGVILIGLLLCSIIWLYKSIRSLKEDKINKNNI